ncbi:MAG TPA: cupredoxin domain-containing protein [Chloroflexota bacterium]|jgi:plastocyanin
MLRLRACLGLLLIGGLALVPGLVGAAPAAAQPSELPGSQSDALSLPASVIDSLATGQAGRGCGSGQQSVPAAAIADLPRVQVSIYDGFFLPAEVTVPRGAIVVWTNHGSSVHTATAGDRWDSGSLRPGESCEAWFVSPGTYNYVSSVAADSGAMTGTITVAENAIGTRPSASADSGR